ncbi:MAG: glycoside hydrolase family 2 [Rikenellaceae bacterium]
MRKTFLLLIIACTLYSCNNKPSSEISLASQWDIRLDSTDIGLENNWQNMPFDEKIALPGTTDKAQMGIKDTLTPALQTPQLLKLTRNYSYVGKAWYTREVEIPEGWNGKDIELLLERIIWHTEVWIDGNKVKGEGESLTTPHRFDLTEYLKAGEKHRLTICVDNNRRYDISVGERNLGHSYTNETQIIWNGILGDIKLSASDKVSILNSRIIPNIEKKTIEVWTITQNNTEKEAATTLTLCVESKDSKTNFEATSRTITIPQGIDTIRTTYTLGDKAVLWDEFTPQIYTLLSTLSSEEYSDTHSVDFGMRELTNSGSRMAINGRPLFLRGTLECSIFPLTGTPPTTHEGWAKVFSSAKEWGLNHLRFHSWCPPQDAFEVADSMGFYLQIELPVWSVSIKEEDATTRFIREEGRRIITEYGNHPSLCFVALGNELQSNFDLLADMLLELKTNDSRHLYTTTAFTFETGHGDWPEPLDDFFITQWTKKGWVRGQGVFNSYSPSFDKDFSAQVEGMEVPLITHEVGQYSVYPNMAEIDKYTGVLKPLNFISVREDLKAKGLLEKAALYTEASGRLAAILYKEEIERAMKTSGISGYQLLDLHDFPGQGTALVGLLDAFWDSKGVETAEHFRQFASPVVPLVRFEKATYLNSETFTATVEVSNYSAEELKNQAITWSLNDGTKVIAEGKLSADKITWGHNAALGAIEIPLSEITAATKANLKVTLEGTEYKNDWNIWVYPSEIEPNFGDVCYTRSLSEAKKLLAEGKKVLLNPDWRAMEGIEGKFLPVFWSPVHFPKQAATMGLLTDPSHPALKNFPTDMHSNWQWWDLTINSTTMIVDNLKGITPIVEQVDNFANNRRLASMFEARVGEGSLVVATFDLANDLDKRPVAKQMLYSVLEYMNSSDFAPKTQSDISELENIIEVKNLSGEKESATSIY